MKITVKIFFIVIAGLMPVSLTPFIFPVTLEKPGDLHNVEFGAPLSFIHQDMDLNPPPDFFPFKVYPKSPWECPTQFNWINYILSTLLVGLVLWILITGIERLRK